MNLSGDFVEFEVPGYNVEQDQVGLKMEGGVEGTAVVILLLDQILPGRLESRPHGRSQVRLMSDEQDSLGKGH